MQNLTAGCSTKSCVSPGMENAKSIKQTLELSWPRPVLNPVVSWPLYISHGAVVISLLFIIFGGVRSIQLTRFLIFIGFSFVEGCLLSQGILISDGKHLLRGPMIFHRELVDQGQVSEPLLEELDD
jgi:hypothetical protein